MKEEQNLNTFWHSKVERRGPGSCKLELGESGNEAMRVHMVSSGWTWLSEISDIVSRSEVSEGSEVPDISDHSRTVNTHEVFRNCKFMCTQTLPSDRQMFRRGSPSARLDGSTMELACNIPDIAPRHGLVVFDRRANISPPVVPATCSR